MNLIINAITKKRDSFGTLHVEYRFTEIKTGEFWYYHDSFEEGSHHEAESEFYWELAKRKAEKGN